MMGRVGWAVTVVVLIVGLAAHAEEQRKTTPPPVSPATGISPGTPNGPGTTVAPPVANPNVAPGMPTLMGLLSRIGDLENRVKALENLPRACIGTEAAKFGATTFSCSPYQCRNGTCLTSCNSDQDCAASHVCRSNHCLLRPSYCSDDPNTGKPGDGRYVVTSDRQFINCLPYVCSQGYCRHGCSSTADCYTGWVCSADGKCEAPH